jgi:hypothetical protein
MRGMTATVGACLLFIAWGLGDAPALGERPRGWTAEGIAPTLIAGWVALRSLPSEMRGACAGRDAPAVRAPGADGGTRLGRHPR